jgi:hypothetical protein
LLDGIDSTGFLRTNISQTVTAGQTKFNSATNMSTASGDQARLEVRGSGSGNDAFMAFHVGGDYAAYLGLDGGTNKFSVGGWSMGAVSHALYHEGNKPSLATLGYTGASNANYITNNNQLTNGAGYTNDQTAAQLLAAIKTVDGSGSGLDADTVDGIQASGFMAAGGGGNATFTDLYSTSWFRSTNSNTGMYNQATGQHFYSDHDDYWNIAGGTAANALRFRDEHNGTVRGYVYADNGNNVGLLNSGGSWSLKCDNSGNMTATGNVTAYSDARLKTDIKTIPNALDTVVKLRGVTFTKDGKHSTGVIAQEIEAVFPVVVQTQDTSTTENPDGLKDLKSVAYGNMVGLLIEAIKEQQVQIDELKALVGGA